MFNATLSHDEVIHRVAYLIGVKIKDNTGGDLNILTNGLITGIRSFKGKIRININLNGQKYIKELLSEYDFLTELTDLFSRYNRANGAKYSNLVKNAEQMSASKIFVIYKGYRRLGAIVSFNDGTVITNSFVKGPLVKKYLWRFVEAELDNNIFDVVIL